MVRVRKKNDYDAFEKLALKVHRLIIKPNFSAVGSGIRAVDIADKDESKLVFGELMLSGREWVAEERISQSDEMAQWNDTSVNTIRVSSFLNNKGFYVLSSILRTGRKGAIVDNAGRGGISAAIDPLKGIIISNGMDKKGNWYDCHPDSGRKYQGTQIPKWMELINLVESIHRSIPNQIYVGWDFALTEKGWVLIEGNWGELGAQQVALGYGLKPLFDKYLYSK